MIKRRAKAPKYPQGQAKGITRRFGRSSIRQPKPVGIDPNNPHYGIVAGKSTGKSLAGKGNRLFGIGRANSSNQGQLARKAKRQVG